MASMDVFKNNAFTTTSLTSAIDKKDHQPNYLGSLNIFEPLPSRTRDFFVDRRDGGLKLIPVSPVGSPPTTQERDVRDAVPMRTVRLAKDFMLYAEELNGIRAFGTETELMQVQAEYMRRMARVDDDMEMTFEFHRLGALQGILLDADGVSVIDNYYTKFGVVQPAPINFELTTDTTDVHGKCTQVIRTMARASRGAMGPGSSVHALCGDTFYDELAKHPQVRETYLHYQAAQQLQNDLGQAFGRFRYGNVTWHNYRGTDDNSTVAVPTGEAKFFPVGARDIFKHGMGPAEFMPWVNAPGRRTYALNIPDRDRQAWTKGELYSYPLFFCQRPEVLQSAVNA